MKNPLFNLFRSGRTLVRVKDQTGVYKLPNRNMFPKFGSAGRQKVVLPSVVCPAVPVVEPARMQPMEKPDSVLPVVPVASNPRSQRSGIVAAAWRLFPLVWGFFWRMAGVGGAKFLSALRSVRQWFSQLRLTLPQPRKFFRRSARVDGRPRAQAELALEKVTVLRNDLSEADVVVMTVAKKAIEPATGQIAPAAVNSWSRVTARWINLKQPAAPGGSGGSEERSGNLARIEP